MSADPTARSLSGYVIATPVYEGPLDLLLQLIERAELDITRLALAQVTDQYLEHLRNLPEMAAEEVSAFLVMAARLLQIKSEALLPRPPIRQAGEEDPGEALTRQLLVYKRYREIANLLAEREAAGLRTYLRLAPPPRVEGTLDLSDISLSDLQAAAQTILGQGNHKPALSSIIAAPRLTIREKINHIASLLRHQRQITFRDLLGQNLSHLEIVVTFLAMLELVKRHLVQVRQERLFGEIGLEPTSDWEQALEFETEFGE